MGVKFSPDGGCLATACIGDSTIRIFDAHNGDQLVSIENAILHNSFLPIAWSTHGQELFAISKEYQIKSFDSSTGSPRVEWKIHENDGGPMSIALSASGKFIASSAGCFVSFWDTSTHTQLGIVEGTHMIESIALSPDGYHLAMGSTDLGSSIIQDLRGILPGSYMPGNISTPFLKPIMTLIHDLRFCTHVNYMFQTVSAGSSCVQNGELIPMCRWSISQPRNPYPIPRSRRIVAGKMRTLCSR